MTTTNTIVASTSTVAVGIDIGSYNARVATFEESTGQAVCAHNSDGHRTTKVVMDNNNMPVDVDNLSTFIQEKLIPLATDAAHTKEIHVVASIPNDSNKKNKDHQEQWLAELHKCCHGGVISEAAAVCLAYGLEETAQPNQCVLVIDGGYSGIKATKLRYLPGGNDLWTVETTRTLSSVNGISLVEPLAQSVAQQFEVKYRFPKGEVWQSKKARTKLQKACEEGLTTMQINNSLTIHVDGLYEGMDCQVTISKAKWDHLSSKLVMDTKEFLKTNLTTTLSSSSSSLSSSSSQDDIDMVLLSGNMHPWLKPIVQGIYPGKMVLLSDVDPAEAIALGCTKQAKWSLENMEPQQQAQPSVKQRYPSMTVFTSPISIGINRDTVIIEQGTPLPVMSIFEASSDMGDLDIWQLYPTEKKLATLDNLNSSITTIRLLLSKTGKLQVGVDGECYDL
jgi:molecular chaperone DnaK (HSP70)